MTIDQITDTTGAPTTVTRRGKEFTIKVDPANTETDVRRVYLARHGRTALNTDDRLRGPSDPHWIVSGSRRPPDSRRHWPRNIPVVISSPLQRAVDTATAIGEATRTAVVIDVRLNDRDCGPWNGKPRTEVVRRYGSIDAAPGSR